MATTAKAQQKLEIAISGRRTAAQQLASRRLYWMEMTTSLWAPVSAFVIALILYIILVEVRPHAATWAQPGLKTLGLLLVGWWAVLGLARLVFPDFRHLRRLRREAREICAELEHLLVSVADKLDPRAREKLIEQAATVDAQRIAGNREQLDAEIKKLTALGEKHLSTWRSHSAFEFGVGLIKALAIALLIRSVLIEPFKIPSGSMIPTLEIGDQIFVNKFIYGVRIPWINKVPFVIDRLPKRGDVIVFNNPLDESKDFIKRVVGVPGDQVELIREVVYINGQPQPRKLLDGNFVFYNQDQNTSRWYLERAELFEETLSGHPHKTLQMTTRFRENLTEGPWVVPEGHVFVLGDNRDNSSDSRYGFGVSNRIEFVPYGNIKGKAMVIWLSLSYGGVLGELFGGTGLRTDRLFLPIQ